MSAHAASLQCPICFHSGVFDSAESLRNRLISVSTNKILCPVCQDEVIGLDKLTIHLFSHVKIVITETCMNKKSSKEVNSKAIQENDILKPNLSVRKKSKASVSKNKSPPAVASEPVKFVKIYPKLPVVSLNTMSAIDISQVPIKENVCKPVLVSTVEMEAPHVQTKLNTTCNICGLQFVDCNILKMHRCLIHNIEENSDQNFTRYNCHLCPKNFKMRGSLMVHLRMAHYGFMVGNCSANSNNASNGTDEDPHSTEKPLLKNDNKQWQCDVCRKCFTTKYFLKKHKRLHTGETPYSCTQCNKTFTFQQSYHKHLLYHNDEKPHTCSYCGRAFKELSTLHNHQRIHTGEKPFSCETCGKCFRQRVSYLVHRRIHTGVMPYKCTACEKSFRYKVSQRTHKCRAQPPGTVVRQNGDLLVKLKMRHANSNVNSSKEPDHYETHTSARFLEVSEANAELVRSSAKLSFEDTETENFSLIPEHFDTSNSENDVTDVTIENRNTNENDESLKDLLNSNFNELIDSMAFEEKNVPSPSDILKKLCLSQEEDTTKLKQNEDGFENYDIFKEFI